jgi:hypothetical protein
VYVLSIMCAALGVGLMVFLLASFLFFIWKGATSERIQKDKKQLVVRPAAIAPQQTANPLADASGQSSPTRSPSVANAPTRRMIRGSTTDGLMMDEEAGMSPEYRAPGGSAPGRTVLRNGQRPSATPWARGLRGSFVATSATQQIVRTGNRQASSKTPTNGAATPRTSPLPHSRDSISPAMAPHRRPSNFAMQNPLLASPKKQA